MEEPLHTREEERLPSGVGEVGGVGSGPKCVTETEREIIPGKDGASGEVLTESYGAIGASFRRETCFLKGSACPDQGWWYDPLTGIVVGLCAAVVPVLCSSYYSAYQGVVLLTSALYVFQLEWLTRFRRIRDFGVVCEGLRGADASSRLSMIRQGAFSGVGAAAVSLLIGAKMLAVYLLFTRLALFEKCTVLSFALISVPVFGQTTKLFLGYGTDFSRGTDGRKRYGLAAPVLWGVLLVLSSGSILILERFFGDFISFQSASTTYENLSRMGPFLTGLSPAFLPVILVRCKLVAFLFTGAFFSWMYWRVEADKQLGTMPREVVEGSQETTELLVLAMWLLIADALIF